MQMDKAAIIQAIASSDIGLDLDAESLDALAKIAQVMRLEAGEVLLDQGQPGEHIYLLVKGGIQIQFPSYGKDEPPQEICRLSDGAIVGEMSMLEGEVRSARSLTVEPSVFLAMRDDALLPIFDRLPRAGYIFMRNLARVLSRRLRFTNMAIRLQLFG